MVVSLAPLLAQLLAVLKDLSMVRYQQIIQSRFSENSTNQTHEEGERDGETEGYFDGFIDGDLKS